STRCGNSFLQGSQKVPQTSTTTTLPLCDAMALCSSCHLTVVSVTAADLAVSPVGLAPLAWSPCGGDEQAAIVTARTQQAARARLRMEHLPNENGRPILRTLPKHRPPATGR